MHWKHGLKNEFSLVKVGRGGCSLQAQNRTRIGPPGSTDVACTQDTPRGHGAHGPFRTHCTHVPSTPVGHRACSCTPSCGALLSASQEGSTPSCSWRVGTRRSECTGTPIQEPMPATSVTWGPLGAWRAGEPWGPKEGRPDRRKRRRYRGRAPGQASHELCAHPPWSPHGPEAQSPVGDQCSGIHTSRPAVVLCNREGHIPFGWVTAQGHRQFPGSASPLPNPGGPGHPHCDHSQSQGQQTRTLGIPGRA